MTRSPGQTLATYRSREAHRPSANPQTLKIPFRSPCRQVTVCEGVSRLVSVDRALLAILPYTERLAEAEATGSVGSRGDSYDCETPWPRPSTSKGPCAVGLTR